MSAKVYTKTGDQGETCLIGGRRVSKTDLRLEASGTVDELNSAIGLIVSEIQRSSFAALFTTETVAVLEKIQSSLFDLGSHVSCDDPVALKSLPAIHDANVTELELLMDRYTLELSPLRHFILPGGHPSASCAHLARTIARRAERTCVRIGTLEPILIRYLNRLSDYCFVLARLLNAKAKQPEILWKPR